MSLQEQLRNDFQKARLMKNIETSNYLSLIISEIQRQPTKEVADDKVVMILNYLLKKQEELKKFGKSDTKFIEIINNYLPDSISNEDIKSWIKDNIDFSQFKNKMQAIKLVKSHFGDIIDGNVVKEIIQNWKE